MIPNRTIIGNRGSGKSVSLEAMILEVADRASILLIDWPGTLADRMTARMCQMGLSAQVVVDKAGWVDRMPQWRFRRESVALEPLTRRIEEQSADESLLLACFSRRYEKDALLAPATYRSALAAVRVFYGIEAFNRPPLDYIACLFRPGDPVGRWMLDETVAREDAGFFREAEKLARRSPQQWEVMVGSGGRLLDVLTSPVVWTRNGASFDWKSFVARRGHYYLGMEGLAETTATTLAVLTYEPAIRAARELFEETGRAHPLVVVLEEAGALGLVTPIVTTAMQAYRKHGVAVWVASQTVEDFRDPKTLESILAMSEHYWHQMASGVERAARDCANPTYDPDRGIHARSREAVVSYERVPTETRQFDRHHELRSVSRGSTFRPVLGVRTEEVYDNPANHEAEFRRKLSTLKVGERFFRGLDGTVRKEVVPPPDEPFGPFAEELIELRGKSQSLARHRLNALHDRLRQSPLYQPPPLWNPPPSLRPSAPAPIPDPATDGEPSGMRGS